MTRRTNVGLLLCACLAFGSGWVAFAVGVPGAGQVLAVLHGMAGVGVLLLAPRKSRIVRRGLRRARPDRAASVLLAVLAVLVVATGLAHSGGLTGPLLGLTTMQVHVAAALAAVPLLAWHALHRPSRPRRTDLGRRSLLRAGTAAGAGGLVWLSGEGLWAADRRFTGSHERGTDDPAAMPVTQWLFDRAPDIGSWRLRVGDRTLAAGDLPTGDHVRAVLDCTGGWYAEQDWQGVRVDRLLGPPGGARSILVRSATGYARRFPVSDRDRLWLATTCAGRPLSPGHGAPARLVAPGRRGFWWVKWVGEVTYDDLPAWRQPPFPLS
jgi:hypothetical protein